MLISQSSVEKFLAVVSDKGYLAGIGHRTAALEDSRLLPIVDRSLPCGTPTARPTACVKQSLSNQCELVGRRPVGVQCRTGIVMLSLV